MNLYLIHHLCVEGAGLDLALILEDLVGLDDDHGEIGGGKLFDVAKPKEVILAFSSSGSITGVQHLAQTLTLGP